jgi:hypothetical protein
MRADQALKELGIKTISGAEAFLSAVVSRAPDNRKQEVYDKLKGALQKDDKARKRIAKRLALKK